MTAPHAALRWASILILAAVLAAACGPHGDPGYTLAFRNESDRAIVVRGDDRWLLPPGTAAIAIAKIGPPREANPIDYEILDEATCRVLAVQRVDFALAPNPGYSEFIVNVLPDLSTRLDVRAVADPAITGSLETTSACP